MLYCNALRNGYPRRFGANPPVNGDVLYQESGEYSPLHTDNSLA